MCVCARTIEEDEGRVEEALVPAAHEPTCPPYATSVPDISYRTRSSIAYDSSAQLIPAILSLLHLSSDPTNATCQRVEGCVQEEGGEGV
eukprot:2604638-Rhodomonas_salina.1